MKTLFFWCLVLLNTVQILGQEGSITQTKITTDSLAETSQLLLEHGRALYKEQKPDSALVVLEKARVLSIEEKDWMHYFQATNKMGDCYLLILSGEGADVLEDALVLAEKVNFTDPETLGNLYQILLRLKRNTLESTSAIKYGKLSIESYKKVLPENHIKVIDTYIDLTTCYIQMSNWEKAEEYIKKSIIPEKDQIDTSAYYRSIQCKAVLTLASVQEAQFKFTEAIYTIEEALSIAESINDQFIITYVYYKLGTTLQRNNEIDKARFYLHKSNRFFIEHFGENHPYVLETYKKLAYNYRLTDKDKRISYLKKAIKISETLYSENNIQISALHIYLGSAYMSVENYPEAIKNCRKAQHLQGNSFSEFPLGKLDNYILFYRYFGQKENFNIDSLSYYTDLATDLTIDLYGENSRILTKIYNAKARAFNYNNQTEKALKYIEKSLKIVGENNYLDAAYTYVILSEIQFKGQNDAENAMKSLETAYQMFSKLRQDETKIYDDFNNIHDLSAQFAADIYFEENSQGNFNQLNLWLERKKGQQLKNIFNATKAEKIVGLPQRLIDRDKKLNQKLFHAKQELLQAEEKLDSVSIAQIREVKIPKLSNELVSIREEIKNKYPEYYNLKYNTQTYQLTEIKNKLTKEEILLSYNLSEKNKEGLCLVLSKNQQTAIELKIDKNLDKRIETFTKLLKSPTLFRKDKREKFTTLSFQLYQELIAPMQELLVDKSKIIIIGDGITHYLPFEVLLKNSENKDFHELDYLVNDFEISYHYSATLFAQSREKEAIIKEGLLAFAPVFSSETDLIYAPNTVQRSEFDSLSISYRAVDEDGNFVPLIYSLEEVKQIATIVDNNSNQKSDVLTFEKANEQNLKSLLESPHRFVHIASHSFANLRESKFSGIACAPLVDSTTTEDGTLYVGEVYNLDIPADLVVLSSCESGLGKLQAGEGLIGLNRSFIYSGVPNVVFSLWKVNDKVSSELMIEFYREVLDGEDYASALRKAKLKLLSNENTASPNLWSSFLLIGR